MARAAKRSRRLWDTYLFPGFRPEQTVRGTFGDPKARVITFKRRSKKTACGWKREGQNPSVAHGDEWGGPDVREPFQLARAAMTVLQIDAQRFNAT
jgi:hypothetical protein